jgi:hypothetical protein
MNAPRAGRRAFLAGALAVPATAALPGVPVDRVREAADSLADAMHARHGGEWMGHVDHDYGGFVLVQPARRPKGGAV